MSQTKLSSLPIEHSFSLSDSLIKVKTKGGGDVQVPLQDFLDAIGASMFNPYKFSVYRNAAYTTTSNAATALPFDTALFDSGSNIDLVTHKGRFTAPVDGFYWFGGRHSCTTSRSLALLYKNGSEADRGTDYSGSSAIAGATISSFLELVAGDYIEYTYFIAGAVALDVGAAPVTSSFKGFLVSAT